MSPSKDSTQQLQTPAGPPSGYFVVVPATEEPAIDFVRIASIVRASWLLLIATTFLGALVGALISLHMLKVYRAATLVVPVAQSSAGNTDGLRTQFGGLAALAGIDLSATESRKREAIATLESQALARDFIESENLLPILFADLWDARTNNWRFGVKPPTLESGVRKFTNDVRFVKEDRTTGLVTLMVEWYSPELAAHWANQIISKTNERLRAEAMRNAQQNIEYLNQEVAKTNIVELRQAISHLIEAQVNEAMLASVQREYAFHVIDQAIPPDIRFRPQRILVTVFGAAAGLLTGLILALLRRVVRHDGPRPPQAVDA